MSVVRYILDTHALVWAATDPDRLGAAADHIISTAAPGEIGIPSALIIELGRLIDEDAVVLTGRPSDVFAPILARHPVLPMSLDAAIKAPRVNLSHKDPYDRLIVAEALVRGVPLITKDSTITDSGLVRVIW